MKSKKVTYLLGLVVAVVWGLIIYRIIAAAGGNDEDTSRIATSSMKKEPYNDYEISKDTTRLLLNYRDPFVLTKSKDSSEIPVKKLLHQGIGPIIHKPAMNWGFIQYSGYIHNPQSKKVVSMLSINGKNELFKDGDQKDQVKLIRNYRDSVKISYNGYIKFITMKPASL